MAYCQKCNGTSIFLFLNHFIHKYKWQLTIKIEDNGVGVKKSLSSKLEMEGDHKSQGMEITSKRIELLKKVSNNEIELIGPLQIESEDGLINGTRVLIKIRLSDLEN